MVMMMTMIKCIYLFILASLIIKIVYGIPLSQCGTISSPGTYTFSRDIFASSTSCIIINADDVILDGAGYRLTSTFENSTYAIDVTYNNAIIQNVIIQDFNIGVKVTGNGALVRNVTVQPSRIGSPTMNMMQGFEILYHNHIVEDNKVLGLYSFDVDSVYQQPILLAYASNCTIRNNIIDGFRVGNRQDTGLRGRGMLLYTVVNSTIANNTISNIHGGDSSGGGGSGGEAICIHITASSDNIALIGNTCSNIVGGVPSTQANYTGSVGYTIGIMTNTYRLTLPLPRSSSSSLLLNTLDGVPLILSSYMTSSSSPLVLSSLTLDYNGSTPFVYYNDDTGDLVSAGMVLVECANVSLKDITMRNVGSLTRLSYDNPAYGLYASKVSNLFLDRVTLMRVSGSDGTLGYYDRPTGTGAYGAYIESSMSVRWRGGGVQGVMAGRGHPGSEDGDGGDAYGVHMNEVGSFILEDIDIYTIIGGRGVFSGGSSTSLSLVSSYGTMSRVRESSIYGGSSSVGSGPTQSFSISISPSSPTINTTSYTINGTLSQSADIIFFEPYDDPNQICRNYYDNTTLIQSSSSSAIVNLIGSATLRKPLLPGTYRLCWYPRLYNFSISWQHPNPIIIPSVPLHQLTIIPQVQTYNTTKALNLTILSSSSSGGGGGGDDVFVGAISLPPNLLPSSAFPGINNNMAVSLTVQNVDQAFLSLASNATWGPSWRDYIVSYVFDISFLVSADGGGGLLAMNDTHKIRFEDDVMVTFKIIATGNITDTLCLGYIDTSKNVWVCEDRQLTVLERSENTSIVRGRTPHFTNFGIISDPSGRTSVRQSIEQRGSSVSFNVYGLAFGLVGGVLVALAITLPLVYYYGWRRKAREEAATQDYGEIDLNATTMARRSTSVGE
eukprot:TRINITY_DN10303_c0_g1_i1.p1 TRINITY_DN10303_c0_g1~~TRINITY_DN10303_c0_g1_i1.p1  ORF type:complete len:893 (+),score=181.63 TRINITY_DN10303_c0_g1_i1:58-2736(+)